MMNSINFLVCVSGRVSASASTTNRDRVLRLLGRQTCLLDSPREVAGDSLQLGVASAPPVLDGGDDAVVDDSFLNTASTIPAIGGVRGGGHDDAAAEDDGWEAELVHLEREVEAQHRALVELGLLNDDM